MIGLIGLVFALCLLLGLPIGVGIVLSALTPSFADASFLANAQYVIRNMLTGLDSTPLLAVPMFMLSGAIMAKGGISEKLFNVFAYFMGKRTAGMPCAVIITCLFFGAISGSGPATCAAVGAMTIPVLVRLGYDKVFAAAICATAGGLGVIIPPSIPFILYGLSTGTSVGDLFLAGIIPGILIAISLMVYAYIYCKGHGEDKEKIRLNHEQLQKKGLWGLLKESFWAILTPVIILGGIYGGYATPTEAATISVAYSLIVCIFCYRSIRLAELPSYLMTAVKSYAPLLLLFMSANAFGRVLTLTGAPQQLADWIMATFSGNSMLFMYVFMLILLLVGMFMDVAPAILILGPMIVPALGKMGLDPVYVGVVMVVALAIGFVTPPFGVNLFVAAPMGDTKVMTLARVAAPFIIAFILSLMLIVAFPPLGLILTSRA